MARRILLIDRNAPWVHSLFSALPQDVEVYSFRVCTPGFYRRSPRLLIKLALGWERVSGGFEKYVGVPGWTLAFDLSTSLLAWQCKRLIRRVGRIDAVIYTIPQYAGVAERLRQTPSIYQSFDPYRYYGWNVERTIELERRIMATSKLVLAVSRQLAEDLQADTDTQVSYFPNAVSESFLAAADAAQSIPDDLRSICGKIIGCTGQMNSSYDWGLIEALTKRLPDLTFVFVGPIFDEGVAVREMIDRVLSQPNVRWTGPKAHCDLPAYLARFDVCFNPLAVNAHNDRRSPLRLYDYLATSKPILSTAIRESFEHLPYIEIGRGVDELEAVLRRMTREGYVTDLQARRAYIRRHTWVIRAEELAAHLQVMMSSGASGDVSDIGNRTERPIAAARSTRMD